ncbi:UNVERIFIED_CONTAM: hypothetical protein FKN15_007814 [Acipenser sinensis]
MVIMDELCEMDCNVLKRLVRDDSGKCLVLDCRSFLAHSAGHIRGSVNIRCNTIVRRRAKGSVSLDQILSGDEEVRSRLKSGLYSAVILYDERTSHMDSIKEDSTITLVLNALYRDSYGTEIYLLKGGYDKFSSDYPEFCSKTKIPSGISFIEGSHIKKGGYDKFSSDYPEFCSKTKIPSGISSLSSTDVTETNCTSCGTPHHDQVLLLLNNVVVKQEIVWHNLAPLFVLGLPLTFPWRVAAGLHF